MENAYDHQQMMHMMPPETFSGSNFVCPTSAQWSNGYLPSNTDLYGTSLVCVWCFSFLINHFFGIWTVLMLKYVCTNKYNHACSILISIFCAFKMISLGFQVILRLLQSPQPRRLQQLLSPSVQLFIFFELQLPNTDGFELQFLSRKLPLSALQPAALLLSVALVQCTGRHGNLRVCALRLIRLFVFIWRQQLFQKGYFKLRDVLLIKCILKHFARKSSVIIDSSECICCTLV